MSPRFVHCSAQTSRQTSLTMQPQQSPTQPPPARPRVPGVTAASLRLLRCDYEPTLTGYCSLTPTPASDLPGPPAALFHPSMPCRTHGACVLCQQSCVLRHLLAVTVSQSPLVLVTPTVLGDWAGRPQDMPLPESWLRGGRPHAKSILIPLKPTASTAHGQSTHRCRCHSHSPGSGQTAVL